MENFNLNSFDYNNIFVNIEKLLTELTTENNLKEILQEIVNDRRGNNSQPNFKNLSNFVSYIYENLNNNETNKKLLCDIVDIFLDEQSKINYVENSNRQIDIDKIVNKIKKECRRYSL